MYIVYITVNVLLCTCYKVCVLCSTVYEAQATCETWKAEGTTRAPLTAYALS